MSNNNNAARNDIHRPSAIIPADYEYVSVGPVQYAPLASRANMAAIAGHMERTGGAWATHNHGGNCHVCGSVNLVWWICYRNIRTNEYIKVGEECAGNIDFSGNNVRALNLFRKSCRIEAGVAKGQAKAKAYLAGAGLDQAFDVYESSVAGYEENIIRDIIGKLVKYGSISEKQTNFVSGLMQKIGERAAKIAQRAIENESAADFPVTDERVKVVGTVVSTKLQESDFGATWKMLVKTDAGWKVWTSIPGGERLEKGAKISFFAKLQPSRDDAKFGFGSRPTKLEVLEEAARPEAVEPAPRNESNVPDVAIDTDNYFHVRTA